MSENDGNILIIEKKEACKHGYFVFQHCLLCKLEERIGKLENFMPDVLQDFERRVIKLEQLVSSLSQKSAIMKVNLK